MLLKIILLFVISARLCHALQYDRYSAEPISDELRAHFKSLGIESTCTMEVADCDPTERARVDGSCNSLSNPVRGTFFEPVYRVLEPHYYNVSYPRKAYDGSDLKWPKVIRNALLAEGRAINMEFTTAVPSYGIYTFGDVASIHDLLQFLRNKTDCCTEEGKKSRGCSPVFVPEDDPLHRFTGIRCLNLTTPLIYSDFGCTNDTVPSPIERGTAVFDLSVLYNAGGHGDSAIRSYEDGLLTTDVDYDGIIWPPNGNGFCAANQPGETRCFGNYPTALLSSTMVGIWYMRLHNHFAKQLAAVNPNWDDEKLFQTARYILIAFADQVYFYEWCKELMGKENLVKAGVISDNDGFRDVYDESTYPQVSLEYTYVLRWFHTMQDATANMYDADGNFLKAFPYINGTFRPGLLGIDKNIVKFTQHLYRQKTAAADFIVDPDLTQNGVPYLQRSVDITASDLYKSRLFGFAPYTDYVAFCTGHNITCFDDLAEHMDLERIELMKEMYDHHTDIDLLAGIWAEKMIEGGSIPATLACILIEFLKKAVRYDRHWYERPNRPYAFTEDQLAEVRKASLAALICSVGDEVSEVQPHAFRVISDDNPLTACSDIPNIDFSAWHDETADGSNDYDSNYDYSTSDDSTSTDSTSDATASTDSASD